MTADVERLSERLAEDERWQSDLRSEDAQPLLDAGLALLEVALARYSPADPAAARFQAPYREAVATLIREALALAARAITAPSEAPRILRFGLGPLYAALGLSDEEQYRERLEALVQEADSSPVSGEILAAALKPTES